MGDCADKSSLGPRRSSHRTAKTIALSALSTRKVGVTKTYTPQARENLLRSTSDLSLHDICNNLSSVGPIIQESNEVGRVNHVSPIIPIKTRWKAKRSSFATTEVTPNRATPASTNIDQLFIEVGNRSTSNNRRRNERKKQKRTENNNSRENTPEARAHGTKSKKATTKHSKKGTKSSRQEKSSKPVILATLDLGGAFEKSCVPSIQSLRCIKVLTYFLDTNPNEPFPVKLYRMVQWTAREHPRVCRWSKDGRNIEIDDKNRLFLSILALYFKHSRWLSFARQLNNYGFTLTLHTKAPGGRGRKVKSYHHPSFHRGLKDPILLVNLLPYLPGKKKRGTSPRVVIPAKIKRLKRAATAAPPTVNEPSHSNERPPAKPVTPSVQVIRDFAVEKLPTFGCDGDDNEESKDSDCEESKIHDDEVRLVKQSKKRLQVDTPSSREMDSAALTDFTKPSLCKKSKKRRRGDRPSPRGKNGAALADFKTPSPRKRAKKIGKGDISSSREKSRAFLVDLKTPSPRKKSKKIGQGDRPSLQEKKSIALADLKTPSPRYRSMKAKYMPSPPPLSHYLKPKHDQYRQNLRPRSQDDGAIRQKTSTDNESPLPSSLLTVNFLPTPPSPLPNDEPTPRTHNLSSFFMMTPPSPDNTNRSPDGVRMLSWAAQAVESPDFQDDRDRSPNVHSLDGKTTGLVQFADDIGCSPILDTKKLSLDATEATAGNGSNANSSPTTPGDTSIGPSPLCYRNYQNSEIELELLRSCLEDVFVSNTKKGCSNSEALVNPPHCSSTPFTSDDVHCK